MRIMDVLFTLYGNCNKDSICNSMPLCSVLSGSVMHQQGSLLVVTTTDVYYTCVCAAYVRYNWVLGEGGWTGRG